MLYALKVASSLAAALQCQTAAQNLVGHPMVTYKTITYHVLISIDIHCTYIYNIIIVNEIYII